MKNKMKRPLIVILVCFAGIVLCAGVFYLADTVFNGSIVDWFEENFMRLENAYVPEIDADALVRQLNYHKLKDLLFWVITSTVVLWVVTIFAAAHFHAKGKAKKAVTQTSKMLHDYMATEKDASQIFPEEYAEISMQMTVLKTTMQRHEQILKEEAARKNDLITYLAHDLKTPLTSVIGYLSLLDEAPDMPAEQKARYVHITLDKARRLEQLINEFFDITRFNLQQITLEEETIDLYYMLVQMTDEFYPLLQAHGNTAELCAAENLTVYGDAAKLARVFNNVLKNAVAYSYPNTTIKIWTEREESQVKIYIQNKGKTIPSHKLSAIFEKFFRLDEARTTNTGGAGLGLAIAKEIVTLHGGTIAAESDNQLTTFCVALPLTGS